MPQAQPPSNESERLAKLRSLGVLDTACEERFDRIADLAAMITGMPIAAVSLIEEDRQFFKSICGLNVRETPREQAFCAHTILRDRPLVIEDAEAHPLVKDNPLVTGEPGIRFYAGAQILVDGLTVGSLCVIDTKPNRLTAEQLTGLQRLASIASDELTSRVLRMEAEASTLAKSMFLANMSHEIRTPLAAILGYCELLSDPASEEAIQEEAIETISSNASHLLQLVSDVLDVSKIEAEQMKTEHVPLRPDEVVREAIEMLRVASTRAGIQVMAEFGTSSDLTVLGDPTRLRQITLNLLSNAIKFCDGRDVRIVLDCAERDASVALTLKVQDRGIGMTPEQASRIFENFQQADSSSTRRYGGTGLGLPIVKRLSELLGGSVRVETALGEGSEFVVEMNLPLASHRAPDKTESAALSGIKPLHGKRVLLAEDGQDNQRLLTHFLHGAGASVTLAGNGQEAVDAIASDPSGFDCVLMDIQMPMLDGIEATRRLRTSGCTIPILALTANTLPQSMQDCLRAGCNAYANKPVARAKLIGMIGELLGGKQPAAA